jgi:HTH-type transcriptional regulator/antitoxin HigA
MKKSTYLKRGVNIENLIPAKAIHPGELLLDELKSRKITQKKFSIMTGILPSQLNEIIKQKRGISAELSLKIGKALEMDAIIWAKAQMIYDLDLARIKQKKDKQLQRKLSKTS